MARQYSAVMQNAGLILYGLSIRHALLLR